MIQLGSGDIKSIIFGDEQIYAGKLMLLVSYNKFWSKVWIFLKAYELIQDFNEEVNYMKTF